MFDLLHKDGKSNSKRIYVDLLGCCVIRAIMDNNVTESSLIQKGESHQCQPDQIPKMEEVSDCYKIENSDMPGRKRYFYRVKQELNATVKNRLQNSQSDWIIIDFHHADLNSFEVKSGDDIYYIQRDWGKVTEKEIGKALSK